MNKNINRTQIKELVKEAMIKKIAGYMLAKTILGTIK